MENTYYGVGVTNRYALFLSEEDPLEKLRAKEKAKEEKKKKEKLTAGAEKENKGAKTPAVKNKPAVKVASGIKDNQNVKPDLPPKEDATAKPKKPEKVKFNDENKPQTDASKDTVTDHSYSTRKTDSSHYSDAGEAKERRYNGEGGRGGYQGNREYQPREYQGNREYQPREYQGNREYQPREPREHQGNRDRDYQPREPREYQGPREYQPRDNGDGSRGGYRGGMGRPPRGGGRGRGGRGGGDFRGGRREFDRQSGSDRTGVKPTSKRNGGGPHNWGNDRDEIEAQTNGNAANDVSGEWGNQDGILNDSVANNEVSMDKPTDLPSGPASNDGPQSGVAGAGGEIDDPSAREITLDEWKATRGSKLLKPQYNLRKPGEGEDLSRWQGMIELKGKKEEARLIEEQEKAANEIAAKAPKKKEVVDTNFHFADQPTRGGRGKGRGGMRGDRGPREKPNFPRGPRNTPRVDVNNEHDFPSLG